MSTTRIRPAMRRVAALLLALACSLPAFASDGADSLAAERPASAVHPDSAARTSPAAKPARAAVKKLRKPPIDVRALATEQTKTGPEIPPAPQAAPQERKSGAAALVAGLVVAAVSTILILLAISRRTPGARTVTAQVPFSEPVTVEAAEEEKEDPFGTRSEEEEDSFFGVGRNLQTSRGEFDLAMRLHAGSIGDGSRRRARSACTADATVAQRVKVAKKLGIGRGEIDLALRLQKLETVSAEEGTK